ncbi:MAG: response regulator, partial [Desulfobacterales bacterium]|nr:response regulator [Desulfobacterales bacterium]
MKTNLTRQKIAILYVDDERENLDSFKAVFRRDYQVHLAGSAPEALAILDQTHIQVLITDQRMPEISGSDLLKAA